MLCWWRSSTPLLESWLPLVLCAQSSSIRAHTMSSPTCTERTLDSKLDSTEPQQMRRQSIPFLHSSRREDSLPHNVCRDVKQPSRLSSWLAQCQGQAKKVKAVPTTCRALTSAHLESAFSMVSCGVKADAECMQLAILRPHLCAALSAAAQRMRRPIPADSVQCCVRSVSKYTQECVASQQCERLPLQLGCTKSNHLHLLRSE